MIDILVSKWCPSFSIPVLEDASRKSSDKELFFSSIIIFFGTCTDCYCCLSILRIVFRYNYLEKRRKRYLNIERRAWRLAFYRCCAIWWFKIQWLDIQIWVAFLYFEYLPMVLYQLTYRVTSRNARACFFNDITYENGSFRADPSIFYKAK